MTLAQRLQLFRERETERLITLIDADLQVRFAYVPFVICRLVWDYADTIINLASYMRLQETKKLSRAIKELKKEYDKERSMFMNAAREREEEGNMYLFEQSVSHITSQMLMNVKGDLKIEYPDLQQEHVELLEAVYQCDITLKGLIRYTEKVCSKVSKRIEFPITTVLPDSVYKLNKLVPLFAGDKPVSERFNKIKNEYIEILATQIALVNLGDVGKQIRNN